MYIGDEADMLEQGDLSFDEFVARSSDHLFSVALLLVGCHKVAAEDLLERVLERAYRRWRTITKNSNPGPHVIQMLVDAVVGQRPWFRTACAEWRRLASKVGAPAMEHPGDSDDRDLLERGLAGISPVQRTALVLGLYEDLSEGEIATILGCTPGEINNRTRGSSGSRREPSPGHRPAAHGCSQRSVRGGQLDAHGEPAAGCRPRRELAAVQGGTLAHADQPQAARARP
jgi:DNA-directed RNA polymerase specialized sigma24 family protein